MTNLVRFLSLYFYPVNPWVRIMNHISSHDVMLYIFLISQSRDYKYKNKHTYTHKIHHFSNISATVYKSL